MTESFLQTATGPAVGTAELLLAAAAEFHPVDRGLAQARLETLAGAMPVGATRRGTAAERADAIARMLLGHRFRAADRVIPADASFDAVLRRRIGHPLLLAAVGAAAAERAGMKAGVAQGEGEYFVCVQSAGSPVETVLVDPAGTCSRPPRRPEGLCPHDVAFAALGEVSRLFAMHGRIEEAMRAARLRASLPLAPHVQTKVDFELAALRAQLN